MAYGEFDFDLGLMKKITGVDELVYVFNENVEDITSQTFTVMNKYFCANPCDYVMHDDA